MQHYKTQQEIADTFGVSRQSVAKWMKSDGFPDKQKHGWNRDGVTAWVSAKNEREQERAERTGDKQEKTRLECERLRVSIKREEERLEQEKIETSRQKGLLHSVADCEKLWHRAGATLRARVDSWKDHQTAKHPQHRELIDELCASFLATLEGVK